ncbi:G2/mitotic-specific cyclin-B3-like [Porites lutea]|uniref:G2/mitotic-specific cyclin-B3-like n=1 Tax=Porites lutea TaxID=51062 RepID=UPI003CC69D7B
MVKTRSRAAVPSVFYKKSKADASDENGVPSQITVKSIDQGKRSAEGSPENAPSRKRSVFGDITNNAALVSLGGKDTKKKQMKSGVVRKESQRQSKAKVEKKANTKQRRSKELKESSVKKPVITTEDSPSGEILSSQDSIEESASSSQDSLQSTSVDSDKNSKDDTKEEETEQKVQETPANDVIDIDADNTDPVTVSEYAHEIFVNMKRREELFPLTNYLETQNGITPQMRGILVDWLVEVQECFELYHETLYLGVKLLDHFLEKNSIQRDELQLVGATTLIISSKIEERHPPCVDDFIYICDDAYQQQQFIAMESRIMRSLGFDVNIPIPYRFLRRYAKAAFGSIETLTLARFLLESSLLDSRFITYKASHMAASCLYLALLMNNNCTEWTPTLVHYTGYTKDELRECVLQLNAMNAASPNKNLMTVRNKYSHKVFHEVATIPALDTLTIQI